MIIVEFDHIKVDKKIIFYTDHPGDPLFKSLCELLENETGCVAIVKSLTECKKLHYNGATT